MLPQPTSYAHPAPPHRSLAHPDSSAGSFPSPGFRLLPRWVSLLPALSRLGPTQLISRNQHLVAGGPAVYPFPAGPAGRVQLRPQLRAWHEAWYYEETVGGQILRSIEFRDRHGMGFHKLLLTADTDTNFARSLLRAFEQETLAREQVEAALKANHLDGAKCPSCEARLRLAGAPLAHELREFVEPAASSRQVLRLTLYHDALVTELRFRPERLSNRGSWFGIEGGGCNLYIRAHGLGEIEQREIRIPGAGPCREARLRNTQNRVIASLRIEREGGAVPCDPQP